MIYFDVISGTFIGDVIVAASEKGLCAVVIGRRSVRTAIRRLTLMFPGRPVERDRACLTPYRQEVEQYIAGERTHFTRPLDLAAVRGAFRRRVLTRCREVPFGRLVSYGRLAAMAGSPKAARAVGAAMAANPIALVIPCHRVVASGGGLGGFSAGLLNKRRLLSHEGITWGSIGYRRALIG